MPSSSYREQEEPDGSSARLAENLLEVRGLTLGIDVGARSACLVQDVSFCMRKGETLAIVGESGSGKTLTALAVLGLLPPHVRRISGEIFFQQNHVGVRGGPSHPSLRGNRIAMVFQDAASALNPLFRIGEQLSDVLRTHLTVSADAARGCALDLLERVGLRPSERIYDAYPHQLSGGMAQRAMMAMALSCRPRLVIADEPTTSLDLATQLEVLRLINGLQREDGFGLLLISHDLGLVGALADRVVVLHRGRVVEEGPAGRVLTDPVAAYTRSLLGSVLRLPSQRRDPR
jgi:ABC-type glutathione transport system ATPase component